MKLQNLPIKKIVYILLICIFIACLTAAALLPINNNRMIFALNAYFIPLLGAAGALLFQKKWFITPAIVFIISFLAISIQISFLTNPLFTIQLSLLCTAASLIGSLIVVLFQFGVRKWKRKAPIILLKVLSIVIAVILIGGVLFFADSIAGNPISKGIAEARIEKYLQEVYPEAIIQDDVTYSFINTDYFLHFTVDGEEKTVCYTHQKIKDDSVHTYYDEKFREEFPEIKKSLEKDSLKISAFIETYVNTSDDYKGGLEKAVAHDLYLSIECSDDTISEEMRKEAAAEVTMQVLGALKDSYNISSVELVYNDAYGTYTIEREETLTLEQFLKQIRLEENRD